MEKLIFPIEPHIVCFSLCEKGERTLTELMDDQFRPIMIVNYAMETVTNEIFRGKSRRARMKQAFNNGLIIPISLFLKMFMRLTIHHLRSSMRSQLCMCNNIGSQKMQEKTLCNATPF